MSLVEAARSLKGTRFVHRGRTPRGVDCAGMVKVAYQICGVDLPDFTLYSKEPAAHGPGLTSYMTEALGLPVAVEPVNLSDLQEGDILVLRFVREPHHVGMVTNYPYGGFALLHACGMNKKVIEHRLSKDMVRRITHVYRRPV